MKLDVGDTSREYGRTWDTAGALTDPATIALTVTEPDGTVTTYTWAGAGLTREAAGVFYRDISFDAAGVWVEDWASTTPVQAERRIVVVGEPSSGVCDDWIGAEEVFSCAPISAVAAADRDYGAAAEAAAAATRILYLLSERRYPGVCSKTERPCRRGIWCRSEGWLKATPPIGDVGWGVCGCGATSLRDCGCAGFRELLLRPLPVLSVSEVKIDGAVVSSSDYRLDKPGILRRIDGEPWPAVQDLDADDTEVDTFSVSYYYGRTPPDDAIMAVKRLAGELYQGCQGADCKLPRRVRTVISQGMEVGFIDPQEFIDKGRTGILEVDLFLEAERYGHANLPTLTVSPDRRPRARQTG